MVDALFRDMCGAKWDGVGNGADIVAMCNAHAFDGSTWIMIEETPGVRLRFRQILNGVGQAPQIVLPGAPWVILNREQVGLAAVLTDAQYISRYLKSADMANVPGLVAALTVPRSFNNAPGRSIVTGTGSTGFQVSATRDAGVNYNVTTSTTATIGGASTAAVVLELAPINSTTPGDWIEVARVSNGQTITLALALQSVQVLAGNLSSIIPAGYYAKLRSITSGAASASYNSGQEVLL